MELPQPRCGHYAAHDTHLFLLHGDPVECPGWTQVQADIKALYETVWRFQSEHRPPRELPEGTRLEMHPAARHAWLVTVIPSYQEFVSGEEPGFNLIPIEVTPEAGPYSWCLRSDTDVIAAGAVAAF